MLTKSVCLLVTVYLISQTTSKLLEYNLKLNQLPEAKTNLIFLDENYSIYDIRAFQQKYFTITIHIGLPSQEFEFVLDTSSSLSWVGEISATKGMAKRTKYDPKMSLHFSKSNQIKNFRYEAAMLSGYIFNDLVSLSNEIISKEIRTMKLLAINKVINENFAFDGILGLARSYGEEEPGFSLMNYLGEQNLIKKKVFSIKSIDDENGKFYVGDYHTDFQYDYAKCKTIDSEKNKNLWTCKLAYLVSHLNDVTKEIFNEKSFAINQEVIIDSNGLGIIAPLSAFEYFEKNYFINLYKQKCEKNASNYFVEILCPARIKLDDLPTLYLVVDGYGFKISAKNLFVGHLTTGEFELIFAVTFGETNHWIAGQSLFNENHILFDMEKGLVAFSKNYSDFNKFIDEKEKEEREKKEKEEREKKEKEEREKKEKEEREKKEKEEREKKEKEEREKKEKEEREKKDREEREKRDREEREKKDREEREKKEKDEKEKKEKDEKEKKETDEMENGSSDYTAVIVIGILVFIVVIIGIVVFCFIRRKKLTQQHSGALELNNNLI
jgi:hypothetical protein